MNIKDLPRIKLGEVKTPIEKLENLSKNYKNDIYIKRDDLLGIGLGGNKVRKLEYILGDALSKNADIVITSGGVQSNHVRLTIAAANKVDNLIATIDYNGQQIDGSTEHVLSLGNLHAKLEAFGWEVLEEKNGNDLEAVIAVLEHAKSKTGNGKPIAIILHTEMGNGVDFMMGTHAWHGKAPNNDQLDSALNQLYIETVSDY